MGDLGTNSAAPVFPHSTLEPPAVSTHSSEGLPPTLVQESPDHCDGWKTISEQQDLYDEKDFLCPSYNLTSEKLKDRKEDDVVVFGYSLSGADENPPAEEGGPSSGHFSAHDDIFFQVSKTELVRSRQFNKIINPINERRPIHSWGQRLVIM